MIFLIFQDEETPLHFVIANFWNWRNEQLEAVLFLLGEGAKVNAQTKVKMNFMISFQLMIFEQWGQTPLFFAYYLPEISRILIDHGAEVDLADKVRN